MHFIDIANAEEEVSTTHTTAAADTGLLASLGINGQLFVFQLVNFAIVAAIVWFLILKPLTGKMSERQKMIDDSIENAKKVDENLRRSELKFQERVDEAKVEANKIMASATSNAADAVALTKEKARVEIEELIAKAKTHIVAERDRMVVDLKSQTVEIVVEALEKLLKEKVTTIKDQEIIQDLVKKLR